MWHGSSATYVHTDKREDTDWNCIPTDVYVSDVEKLGLTVGERVFSDTQVTCALHHAVSTTTTAMASSPITHRHGGHEEAAGARFVALPDGRRIAYREQGTGPKSLLVLHGLGCSRVAGMPGNVTPFHGHGDHVVWFLVCVDVVIDRLTLVICFNRCFREFVAGDGSADSFDRQAGVWPKQLQPHPDVGVVLPGFGVCGGHSGAGRESLVAGIFLWRSLLLGGCSLHSQSHCWHRDVGSCWKLLLEGTLTTL